MRWEKAFKSAFPVSIPVLTGYMVLGIAYGILMSTKGYGPLWTLLFSMLCFCGSMQFAAIPFLVGKFQPVYVFLLALMVNARHLFYALSMLEKYSGTGRLKWLCIYLMSDETFAINSTAEVPEDMDRGKFYAAVSVLDWSYWVLASVIGNVIGNLITINTAGLDFALTALFVVLFMEQLKNRKNAFCGVLGIVAAIVALIIFGADNLIIPAMVIIFAGLIIGRDRLCD
ncbi:MAG: AzlC family ABC transporter permease [Pseudobutyrivibrio sp.]|nr:AzlC family ABC transporter permease [Pseudobutyrivibrio sp.]